MTLETKTCSKCGTPHPLEYFGNSKAGRGGKSSQCKSCRKLVKDSWVERNRDRVREAKRKFMKKWRDANPGLSRDRQKEFYLANPDAKSAHDKTYRETHRDTLAKRKAKYYADNAHLIRQKPRKQRIENPERVRELSRMYEGNRRARKLMATPLWADAKKIEAIYRVASAVSRVSGTPHHVDHIYPLNSKVVCGLHYHLNLRVIPAADNLSKGNKLLGREFTEKKLIGGTK